MKKQLFLLLISMVLLPLSGAAQNVQQTDPPAVNGHIAFMGIPLSETANGMKTKLLAKGFKLERIDRDTKYIYLTGNVYGVPSRIEIAPDYQGKITIRVYAKSQRLPQAKKTFNTLLAKAKAVYGNGSYETNEDGWKKYMIGRPDGTAFVELFNEDEMDGASDFFLVAICVTEEKY